MKFQRGTRSKIKVTNCVSSEKLFEMKATITLVSVCGFILYFGFETLWG